MALPNDIETRLKTYCRIDSMTADEKDLLELIYNSAVCYLDNAGIGAINSLNGNQATYDMCINAIVLDAWDRRSATVTGTVLENPAFRSRLNQLKMEALIAGASGARG